MKEINTLPPGADSERTETADVSDGEVGPESQGCSAGCCREGLPDTGGR